MIWRWGKSGVISNVELGVLLILQCVVLASFLSTTVAFYHSPPVSSAPSSVPSPPFSSPSAPSTVPSPPFCSRSVATTIGSALLALISLMKDAWGEASAQVSFTRRSIVRSWWRVLWTIVLGLNPIVGTFYVLQTMFVYCKFSLLIGKQERVRVERYEIAEALADSWVTVGVQDATSIPDDYRKDVAFPDPDLVLNLAGTVDTEGNRQWPIGPVQAAVVQVPAVQLPVVQGSAVQGLPAQVQVQVQVQVQAVHVPAVQAPAVPPGGFHFFVLNYEGMLALLLSGVLDNSDYQQLRFLGRRTGLENGIIILQSMTYNIAVVYRRTQDLKVSPIEGIGFACSLLFLLYAFVQSAFGSITGVAWAIYATIRHWHDENFDIPTPSLGRYFPFIR
ncbi:unnamed protein product [Sphagnum jensenii]|uniref:Uncharacterized protein n=1 Tax=Sphagnum jensenii TaxID=128206 RepID=A0ABP1BXQ0_9BRYO